MGASASRGRGAQVSRPCRASLTLSVTARRAVGKWVWAMRSTRRAGPSSRSVRVLRSRPRSLRAQSYRPSSDGVYFYAAMDLNIYMYAPVRVVLLLAVFGDHGCRGAGERALSF